MLMHVQCPVAAIWKADTRVAIKAEMVAGGVRLPDRDGHQLFKPTGKWAKGTMPNPHFANRQRVRNHNFTTDARDVERGRNRENSLDSSLSPRKMIYLVKAKYRT